MLKNFGLFWQREFLSVGWAGRGGNGHLKGYTDYKKKKYVNIVDFREQAGIYFLQDESRNILYVGQSGRGKDRLLKRIIAHSRGRMFDRWSHFSWFGLCDFEADGDGNCILVEKKDGKHQYKISDALNQFEAILIAAVEPSLNKRGGNWNSSTKQFFQYIDEQVDDSIETKIEILSKDLAEIKKEIKKWSE